MVAAPAFWEANGGEAMKAYLTAFPYGKHVSRNIAADKERASMCPDPHGPCRNGTFLWNASASFFNTSWVYGQAQNFGGKPGLYRRCGLRLSEGLRAGTCKYKSNPHHDLRFCL